MTNRPTDRKPEPSREDFYFDLYDSLYTAMRGDFVGEKTAHIIASMAVDLEKIKRNDL